jgi:SOS-response transcriptional repressor LexA
MGNPSERLRALRIKAGFKSARSAALGMGWHPTTYASHENGHRPLTEQAARLYATGYKVSPIYLLTGLEPDYENTVPAVGKLKYLPLFTDRDNTEVVAFASHGTVPPGVRSYAVPDDRNELTTNSFAFEISGLDMVNRPPIAGERSFNPGDVVIVAPNTRINAGDFLLCRINGGAGLLLRKWRPVVPAHGVVAIDNGVLVPLNSDYQPIDAAALHATPVGRVVRHIQKL